MKIKRQKKRVNYSQILRSINNYLVFFILVAFVITCCTMLFVSVLSRTLGIEFTSENIGAAAKLTFANVVILTLFITLADSIRRKLMVDRPVKRITEAAEKVMQGDFTVRVARIGKGEVTGGFDRVIDCFNELVEELSRSETLRSDFIANVSHELKTPLAVMQNYATMLSHRGLSEEKRIEYSKEISEASRRLANLITNILKLSKLENQQIFPVSNEYDLGEQLCECLLSFENVLEQKAFEVETDIEDGVIVRSDAEMMTLVWNNLFSNALKFTEAGGRISLSLRSDGDFAVVQISDTGCGISQEVGKRMFDKFYQGDTSHATQGNGLGLALVKRVVDITESEISVESELGKGTTFTVRMRKE